MRTESLEKAYRACCYRVFLPAGAVDLQIDAVSPALASWLAAQGIHCWALLTAFNPESGLRPAEENAERQSRLEIALLERGFDTYAGENIADRADWPNEDTCLVPGISQQESMALARQFGQNAFIFGTAEAIPQLIWLDDKNLNDQENRTV